jgi:rhomboid protease GluP
VLVGVNDDRCYNCGRRNPALWGFAPALRALGADMGFVPVIIGTCVVLYVLSLLITVALGGSVVGGGLFNILSPHPQVSYLLGASGAYPVFDNGRWWTVLTAGWLHGGILHIFFNMSVLRQMGPAVSEVYGPGRMVIIYIAGSVAGFTLSSVMGGYFGFLPWPLRPGSQTLGASAGIAALIGAVFYYGRRGGSSMARSYASSYIVMLVVLGFFPIVDNYAHAGGFGGGYLVSRLLDPLKPERGDHVLIALVLFGLCLIAIATSVVPVLLEIVRLS